MYLLFNNFASLALTNILSSPKNSTYFNVNSSINNVK